ncbi:MAG: hypothetical protein Q7T81_03955 [Pseudolabrys sp.]|nr:hypothetical protein [Pseudolabrys sp.]
MITLVRLIALLCAFAVANARADDLFTNRPAFSPAEVPARESARCDQIRAMAEGLGEPDERIDLSVDGPLTAVQTDGALWYLVVCNLPDVRVMCVTYQSNDMKPGDKVVIKGAYRRVDPNHALLDPCLASPLDGSEANPASPAK